MERLFNRICKLGKRFTGILRIRCPIPKQKCSKNFKVSTDILIEGQLCIWYTISAMSMKGKGSWQPRHIFLFLKTASMSWSICVVVKQIQSNHIFLFLVNVRYGGRYTIIYWVPLVTLNTGGDAIIWCHVWRNDILHNKTITYLNM